MVFLSCYSPSSFHCSVAAKEWRACAQVSRMVGVSSFWAPDCPPGLVTPVSISPESLPVVFLRNLAKFVNKSLKIFFSTWNDSLLLFPRSTNPSVFSYSHILISLGEMLFGKLTLLFVLYTYLFLFNSCVVPLATQGSKRHANHISISLQSVSVSLQSGISEVSEALF